MQDFRNSLSYEKYEFLFIDIEKYLLNENVSLSCKDTTLTTLLEFIRSYSVFEDNVDKFPINIGGIKANNNANKTTIGV